MEQMTASAVGVALTRLGNYRVKHAGELGAHYGVPQEVLLALGLRETSLKNIEGGAKWDDARGMWVKQTDPKLMDVGIFQISRHYHAGELAKMPGVRVGTWSPIVKGKTANDGGFVPRYEESSVFTCKEFVTTMGYAARNGVPSAQRLRFAVAAHNTGSGGALAGWRKGNVDLSTAGGDYSAWVLLHSVKIKSWLDAHPNWKP